MHTHIPLLDTNTSSTPGSLHVHIDGGHNIVLVQDIVAELNRLGHTSKLRHVVASIAGPQRKRLPEIYGTHTPGSFEESFEYFSTTSVQNRMQAIEVVKLILPRIQGTPGMVVEAEQIVGATITTGTVATRQGSMVMADMQTAHGVMEHRLQVKSITSAEAGATPAATWPYEVHHRFDIVKTTDTPPGRLTDILDWSKKSSMDVGGWFVFDLGERWGYRSNQFMQAGQVKTQVKRQNRSVFVAAMGMRIQHQMPAILKTTLIEKVLGIWKT